jgi:hypothetical protein
MMLADEQHALVDVYEGPMPPMQFNKRGRHAWWDVRDYDEVMVR